MHSTTYTVELYATVVVAPFNSRLLVEVETLNSCWATGCQCPFHFPGVMSRKIKISPSCFQVGILSCTLTRFIPVTAGMYIEPFLV